MSSDLQPEKHYRKALKKQPYIFVLNIYFKTILYLTHQCLGDEKYPL